MIWCLNWLPDRRVTFQGETRKSGMGVVAGWNLLGVDFKTGINNETYKCYIDFASRYGVEYILLDDGWSPKNEADLFKVVPELDLPELVRYGKERNVGLILWAGYYPFDRDMESVCKYYSEMGIKGFKVDYMERDDQLMGGLSS